LQKIIGKMKDEKQRVALISVFAAFLITGMKIVVGVLTGSLGILSEALHSGLDLVATAVTFFAVRMADKPADKHHTYGHGKVENLSALFETLLLIITSFWIIYEAIKRLMGAPFEIEVTFWSFFVMIVSILVDWFRSRALLKVAKKHNSQALEADALHFSTDIWSSAVVIVGLIGSILGYPGADAIAALAVAMIVLWVCYRMGKKSIDVLLDRAPIEETKTITLALNNIAGILYWHDLKVRQSGADVLVEVNIHIDPSYTIGQAHQLAHEVEQKIVMACPRAFVHVHQEPHASNSSKER
jgi:cation diffusion facilitator family transporter